MTRPPLTLESSILIIGAGTWGCSTALHLARRGYRNVRVLDPFAVPSPIAAGNDINKIMEHKELKENHRDPKSVAFVTCTRAALKGWQTDPVFAPYFHETGFIVAASTPELIAHLKKQEIDPMQADFEDLQTPADFRNTMPPGVLTGDFPGWKGWLSRKDTGWIHARKAIVSAATEAKRLGVQFITGSPEGQVVELIYENGDVKGASTADGKRHMTDYTILAAGAVLFNPGKGFFIEPDEDHHELKICDEHPGYCNFVEDFRRPGEERSVPFAREQIPLEAEARARSFLQETMPHLADRPLAFARICWDTDTVDRAFLIDRHPRYASLVVAVGGSGNGAMQMPAIGGFIVDALEGKLQDELSNVVRWRPEMAIDRDWHSTQNRHGGLHKVMNLQEIKEDEWTCINK